MSVVMQDQPYALPWWKRAAPRLDLSMLVWLAAAAILVVLVANPLLKLALTSFQARDGSGFTLANYMTAYGEWRHIRALTNTLVMAAAVVAICLVLALPLAWACARTNMPGKAAIRICALGAFVMPPYLGATGWILLAGPNAGWLNRLWMVLTGGDAGLLNVFSFTGLVSIMAMNLYFFLFIFCTSALEMLSSEMEDAANILGAGPFETARRIILPLILPAILGGAIVTFLQSIALFGVPALISMPARYPVVVTQLWQFFEAPVRVGVAAAYSIPLLAVTVALMGRR
jgi:iron(III) transport system permease protein